MHMGVEDALIKQFVKIENYHIDPAQLRKPLPPQNDAAIKIVSFADPDVRRRILSEETPRDWSKISMRIMADCQSGAFHHYSRFRDVTEHDNIPRVFSLPMMRTGEYQQQFFPPYLVLAAASDYASWRWHQLSDGFDMDIYLDCAERFTQMAVEGDHKCLILLPPEGLSASRYMLYETCDIEATKARHPALNDFWREKARRHPGQIQLIEVADALRGDEIQSAHHYLPSGLKRLAGLIDGWYEAQTGAAESAAA
jgi:hypothetical protein